MFILRHFFNENREYIEKLEKNELGFYINQKISFDQYIPNGEYMNLLMISQLKNHQLEKYDLFSL